MSTAVGSPVCEWVVPWLCCAAPPAARDRRQCTLQTSYTLCVNAPNQSLKPHMHRDAASRDASSTTVTLLHLGASMVMYQQDSPSRMCVMVPLMRQPAWWIDHGCRSSGIEGCLSSSHAHMCTHIDSTSGLVWRTGLRPHTSASSVLPSPLPTRMSLHHLTPSHIPHIPSLLLDVPRLSSVVSSVRHGASGRPGALFPHSTPNVSLSLDDASMQTQAAGHRDGKPLGLGMSHYGPQCAHTDDTAAPSSSGHSISTRH
jgi:hypothetical protein